MTEQDSPGRKSAGREDTAGIFATFRQTPRPVKAILAGILVNKLGAFMQVYLVLFLIHRGFSTAEAGAALGGYGLGSVGGVLLGGWCTDRIGTRRTIIASMAVTAGLLIAVLELGYYPVLLLAVVAVGATSQLYRPASSVLLAELTPRPRQTMVFAMSRLALNVGTTSAPLIGVALLSISYDLLFCTEAAAALGFAAIALFVLPREAAGAGRAEPVRVEPVQAERVRGPFSDRRYLLFLLAQLVIASVYIQYLGVLPLAMKAAHLATFWYGAMVALNSGLVISFELLVTKVVQRWPSRIAIMAGFALTGAGLAFYALPGGLAIFFAGTLLWSLAECIDGPTMFTYPAQAGPDRTRGRYIAAAQSMFGIGSAIGPAGGVLLWLALGRHVWLIFGVVALAAIIPSWFGVRPRATSEPPAPDPAPSDNPTGNQTEEQQWQPTN
jgi:predicted MFS family arabinose efflux permease